DVARELLLTQGYATTTIAQVAQAAGVSPETVQKGFGTKAALAKAVYDVTLVGDDEPVPLRERPEFVAIRAESDPVRKVAAYGVVGRSLWERLGPLIGVLMQGAQAGEPDLVAFVATIRRESYIGASGVVADLAARCAPTCRSSRPATSYGCSSSPSCGSCSAASAVGPSTPCRPGSPARRRR